MDESRRKSEREGAGAAESHGARLMSMPEPLQAGRLQEVCARQARLRANSQTPQTQNSKLRTHVLLEAECLVDELDGVRLAPCTLTHRGQQAVRRQAGGAVCILQRLQSRPHAHQQWRDVYLE